MRHTGLRSQSYDLEIEARSTAQLYLELHGLHPGRYEVKSLWRASSTRSFDPRFKAGRRGEQIYGCYDSKLKAFALALEECIDHVIDDSVDPESDDPIRCGGPHELLSFVEQSHGIIDAIVTRRHSRSFTERVRRIAIASLLIPTMTKHARAVLGSTVQAVDIVNGFSDVEGIFLVAGPSYTLVRRDELPQFISLDSVSSEGLKLRYTHKIPAETKKERNGTRHQRDQGEAEGTGRGQAQE